MERKQQVIGHDSQERRDGGEPGSLAGQYCRGRGGVAATPAAATSKCPRPPDYWANHGWHPHVVGNVDDPLELGHVSKSIAVWKLFLRAPAEGDVSVAMAQQVLAAKLNILLRPTPDSNCAKRELAAHGGRTVVEIKNTGIKWLYHSDFDDVDEQQRCWTVETDEGPLDGEPIHDLLARFNDGGLDRLDCNCPDSPTGDGDDPVEGGRSGPDGGSCRTEDGVDLDDVLVVTDDGKIVPGDTPSGSR